MTRAVLLDAMGVLVELQPPGPALARALGVGEEAATRAFRAEARHYRAHHLRARDAAGLAALRAECGEVLARELGPHGPDGPTALAALRRAMRFRTAPDAPAALDALRARGLRLAVVSNWDCTLPALLQDLGLARRLDAVVVSALVGRAKPHPEPFRIALDRLGVTGEEALHCGDRPHEDCRGAAAAGVRAVLLDPAGRARDAFPCPTIPSLRDLQRYVRS